MDYYIITGTTRGLGESIASRLISENTVLFCLSRHQNDMLAKKAHEKKCELHFKKIDLTYPDSIPTVTGQIFRRIDPAKVDSINLINNAGIVDPVSPAGKNTPADIERNITVNLTSPAILTSIFIAKTEGFSGRKRVLNISSGAGRKAYSGWSAYCSSKSGLDMYSSCAGQEEKEKPNPVQIVSLAPGIIDTDMQAVLRQTKEEDFSLVGKFRSYKEDGALSTPESTAAKIIDFLHDKMDQCENGSLLDIRNFD